MANFQTHVGTAAVLGAVYGGAGVGAYNMDWGLAFMAAGITTLGGMLPDLDSDSGRPVRELSTLAGFIFPILFIPRLRRFGFGVEQIIVLLCVANFAIRYGMASVVRRFSVHRGMFHSLPALAISGLVVFLVYHNDNLILRSYLAGSVMVGFLSHLLLDEIYAVDFAGLTVKFNQFSGSAVKLFSKSWQATALTYFLLFTLGWMAWEAVQDGRSNRRGGVVEVDQNTYRQVIRPGGDE